VRLLDVLWWRYFDSLSREGRNKLLRIRVEESVVRLLRVLRGAPNAEH
jgi:hypothetical protein